MFQRICRRACVVALLLAGCTHPALNPPNGSTSTSSPTGVVEPKGTATNTPMLSATSMAHQEVCPTFEDHWASASLAGKGVILADLDNNNLLLFNFASGKTQTLLPTNKQLGSYAVSPDGKWLAYQETDPNSNQGRLVVTDTTGRAVTDLRWDSSWYKVAYWLDNSRIVLKLLNHWGLNFLVLDPFMLSQRQIQTNVADAYSLEAPPDWNGAGEAIYNPQLNRAVVASLNNEYTLWDMEHNVPLRSLRTISFGQFPTKAPEWSADGETVLIAAPKTSLDHMNDELYVIDMNGEIARLTNLSESFSRISINRYSWSPDRSFIAFLYSASPSDITGEQLGVIDYRTGQSESYCVQGETATDYQRNALGFYDLPVYLGAIWSPDSHQILVENRFPNGMADVLVVDVVDRLVYRIASGKNLEPIGWISGEP